MLDSGDKPWDFVERDFGRATRLCVVRRGMFKGTKAQTPKFGGLTRELKTREYISRARDLDFWNGFDNNAILAETNTIIMLPCV